MLVGSLFRRFIIIVDLDCVMSQVVASEIAMQEHSFELRFNKVLLLFKIFFFEYCEIF